MRVLVTAASRHGGTSAVAEELARTLVAAGLEADLRPPDEVENVREYDAIVLEARSTTDSGFRRRSTSSAATGASTSGRCGSSALARSARRSRKPRRSRRSSLSLRSAPTRGGTACSAESSIGAGWESGRRSSPPACARPKGISRLARRQAMGRRDRVRDRYRTFGVLTRTAIGTVHRPRRQPQRRQERALRRPHRAYVTVSNYPGTTVELTRATLRWTDDRPLVDTPGVARSCPLSDDERVTRDVLLSGRPGRRWSWGTRRTRAHAAAGAGARRDGLPSCSCLNMMDEAHGATA